MPLRRTPTDRRTPDPVRPRELQIVRCREQRLTRGRLGRAVNGKFWVFYGSLSNVEYTITVTDRYTGRQRVYGNPLGTFGSVGETDAF